MGNSIKNSVCRTFGGSSKGVIQPLPEAKVKNVATIILNAGMNVHSYLLPDHIRDPMMNVREQSEAVQSAEVSCTLRASQMIEVHYLLDYWPSKKLLYGWRETGRKLTGARVVFKPKKLIIMDLQARDWKVARD